MSLLGPSCWVISGSSCRTPCHFHGQMSAIITASCSAKWSRRTTQAASSIAAHEGLSVIPYIDDLACAQKPHEAHDGMVRLKQLLTELGLEDEPRKENLPHTQMTWVGIRFDTVAMTMSIPQEKNRSMSPPDSLVGLPFPLH